MNFCHNNGCWHGSYYYGGYGWAAGGLFLVGFTSYTSDLADVRTTDQWIINNENNDNYYINIYNNWDSQDNVSIRKSDDPDWPYYLCHNDGSCVLVKSASD